MASLDNLSDRGIGFQVAGFAIVGMASLVILQLFSGSEHWTYPAFKTAITQLHWTLIPPLAAAFNGVRNVFETRREIREAVRRKIRAEGREEGIQTGIQTGREAGREEGIQAGREEGRRETIALLERRGISVPPEITSEIERLPEDES